MTLTIYPARRRVLAALLACSAAFAGAAAADADAARKPVKQAVFKATLSGSQVTTWEYNDPRDESDPCDNASTVAYGDQTIRFDRKKSFKITFTQPPKSNPNLFLTHGRPAVITDPPFMKVSAEAERNADVNHQEYPINRDQCPVVSDGTGEVSRPETDCGMRTGNFGVSLYFSPLISTRNDDDDLFVPLSGPGFPEKDHLKLESASDRLWVDPRDGSATSVLDDTYENCPFLLEDAYTPENGDIYTSAHKFPEKRLFQRSRRKLVLSGSQIRKHTEAKSKGQTILAWNLRLTRIK